MATGGLRAVRSPSTPTTRGAWMLIKITLGTIVSALVLAPATTLAAAPTLTKKRAKAKAVQVTRQLCADVASCDAYGVDTADECARVSGRAVDCGWTIWDDDSGTRCDSTVRIRLV